MVDKNIRAADPRNYQLPGDVSLWLRKRGETAADKWIDVGNVVSPDIEAQLQTLKHFSQRRGDRTLDKELTSQREASLKFKLDEINQENLKLALLQGNDAVDGTYDANFDKIVLNPGTGLTFSLGQTDVKNVVLRSVGLEDDDEYESGPDYTVDTATGIVTIVGGDLADPNVVAEIHCFFQKQVDTVKFDIYPDQAFECEAKFQVFTPGGIKYALDFLRVVLRPNGAITIGDGTAWQEIPLLMDVLVEHNGDLGTVHILNDGEITE